MTNPRDLIEQAARHSRDDMYEGSVSWVVGEGEAVVSIAISLKRIADALEAGVVDYQRRGH